MENQNIILLRSYPKYIKPTLHKTVVVVKTNDTAKKGRFFVLKDKEFINLNPDGDDRFSIVNNDMLRGVNSPEVSPIDLDPPVPNRAWTAMRNGVDIDSLSEEEKRDLYYGRDDVL